MNFGPPSQQPHDSFRLSDADRNDAINQLARAVGEGRLTIEEFEDRSDDVMAAMTRRDLVPVFMDIPAQATTEVKLYSQGDVDRARANGAKPKLAAALITTLVAAPASMFMLVASAEIESLALGFGSVAVAALIPIVWILLYVAKIGPESWHVPSARQIERQKVREIQASMAQQRAEQKAIESQLWAQRRAQAGELTGEAMNLAKRQLDKWNKK